MDVTITFENGRWRVDPDPAIVVAGTKVRFVVRTKRSNIRSLDWIIDFKGRSPFIGNTTWRIKTRDSHFGDESSAQSRDLRGVINEPASRDDIAYDHRGASAPAGAAEPGDYKYDLRVENAANGETIGQEDPILIVLRKPPSI
jgi:hypothetical protein